MNRIDQIAAAVMYEGYVLWPYRRSAPKNRQRWTFGGVFPRAFSQASGTNDPWQMQTQCLMVGEAPVVTGRVRFLHQVDRRVARRSGETLEFVDQLSVGDHLYLTWEEAVEREVALTALPLTSASMPVVVRVDLPAGTEQEPLSDSKGREEGALVRSWERLEGLVEAEGRRLRDGLFQLSIRVANTTPWDGPSRPEALRHAMLATHVILTVDGGEFLSLTDPPEEFRLEATRCSNQHTWPVLVGEAGERHTLLSAPIILPDYPEIAPESAGDLFDGTEIDQLLLLNILTLTDAEKREMRASDPRAREILERAEALNADEFMRLHGAIRDFRMLRPAEPDPFPSVFDALERPVPDAVTVAGVEVRKGARVRLRPEPGRDLFDVVLAGKTAIVEAIEQDYEDRLHVAVVVEDDPGREFGEARMMGHRFFFSPSELEPLEADSTAPSPLGSDASGLPTAVVEQP